LFQYVDFGTLVGGSRTACERLPAAPALYAWFRNVELRARFDSQDFVDTICAAIEARSAPDLASRLGPMHRVTLESKSELSESRRTLLSSLATNLEFRKYLASLLSRGSLLQAPLYVGKAQNLQARTQRHLQPMSDLAIRLRDADIDITNCILAYTIVQDVLFANDDQTLRLIEEILTRICRPGFVAKPG
jgi:hypothetical protein